MNKTREQWTDLDQQAEPLEPAPAQDERDFWVWLDQAYRDGSKGESPTFTKYNMQVAFKAGAEWQRTRPAQTEQQPEQSEQDTFEAWCMEHWGEPSKRLTRLEGHHLLEAWEARAALPATPSPAMDAKEE